jgi:hypothetical protein
MENNKYFYDKGNNNIYRIDIVENERYNWTCVCGRGKGVSFYSYGYSSLFKSKTIVFGDLKILRLLYGKKEKA